MTAVPHQVLLGPVDLANHQRAQDDHRDVAQHHRGGEPLLGQALVRLAEGNIIRGTHTSASIVIHASRIRRCGNASTASGTSHSEYCGLHTLFVNRNAATTRNATCVRRGRCLAVSAMYPIATQHETNSRRDTC